MWHEAPPSNSHKDVPCKTWLKSQGAAIRMVVEIGRKRPAQKVGPCLHEDTCICDVLDESLLKPRVYDRMAGPLHACRLAETSLRQRPRSAFARLCRPREAGNGEEPAADLFLRSALCIAAIGTDDAQVYSSGKGRKLRAPGFCRHGPVRGGPRNTQERHTSGEVRGASLWSFKKGEERGKTLTFLLLCFFGGLGTERRGFREEALRPQARRGPRRFASRWSTKERRATAGVRSKQKYFCELFVCFVCACVCVCVCVLCVCVCVLCFVAVCFLGRVLVLRPKRALKFRHSPIASNTRMYPSVYIVSMFLETAI